MQLLTLSDIVDARIVNLLTFTNRSAVRTTGNRSILLFADKFLIICAIHSMMVQILRLIEATTLWIE